YNTDGTLDTSFGASGKVITSISGGNESAYGVALQSDGKIVAVGQTGSPGTDFALVRYNTDGSLDNSFGAGGKVTTDFGSSEDVAYGVAIQTDGKIAVSVRAAAPARRQTLRLPATIQTEHSIRHSAQVEKLLRRLAAETMSLMQ
ncbi:MAG: hypothetical protein H0X15_08105, partial [Acidobacteria bacterium]|nr:hypothetical protein [Acidobacteriota bacterium]